MKRSLTLVVSSLLSLAAHAQQYTYLFNSNTSHTAITFQNHLWTGGGMGLIKRSLKDGKIIAHLHEGNSDLPGNQIRYLTANKEEIWIGTDKGLSIYNESKNKWTSPGFPSDRYASSNAVSSITFDRKGNSWILSNGSLWKYAGGQLEKILPERIYGAHAMVVSPDDRLWLSCNQGDKRGIQVYDGKDLVFISNPENSVPAPLMFDVAGNFWGALTNGATRYNGKTWMTYSSGQILAGNLSGFITEDANGNVWFDVGKDIGIYKAGSVRYIFQEELKELAAKTLGYFRNIHFDNINSAFIVCRTGILDYKSKEVFPFPDNLELKTTEDYVQSFFSPDNKLWIVTRNYILRFKDGKFDRLPDDPRTLVGNNIQAIQQDGLGRTWFSTEQGTTLIDNGEARHFPGYASTLFEGRLVFDKQNRAWGRKAAGDGCFMIDAKGISREFTRAQDQRLANVNSLAANSTGDVFCYTPEGVFLYDESGTLKHLPGSPNEYDDVWAQRCDEKQNKCWYVMDNLHEVEGKAWKLIPINALQEPDGIFLDTQKTLWVVSKNDTLYRINKTKTEKYFVKEVSSANYRGYATSGSDLILWYANGAVRFANGKFTYHPLDLLPRNEILGSFFQDSQSNFWFHYSSLGIQYFNGKAWKIITYKDMGFDIVTSPVAISQDSNKNLNIFTDKGIFRRDTAGKWTLSDEVKTAHVYFVDRKKRVWVSTTEGASVFENNQWKHFTNRNGLLSKKVYAFFETATGQIIVRHDEGATMIDL